MPTKRTSFDATRIGIARLRLLPINAGNDPKDSKKVATAAIAAIKDVGATIVRISEISSAIAAAVFEQGAATQEIARNVQQAAQGATEVSSNIEGVAQGAKETGEACANVHSSALSL